MTKLSSLKKDRRPFLSSKYLVWLVFIGDFFLIIASDLSAFTLRFETHLIDLPAKNFFDYLKIAGVIILVRLACFYIFGLYYNLKTKTLFDTITSSFKATSISFLFIVAVTFYFRALAYPRSVIFLSWIFTFSGCILWRSIVRAFLSSFFGKKYLNIPIVIVGTNKDAQRLALHLSKEQYQVVGFINPKDEEVPEWHSHHPILGTWDRLLSITEEKKVEEVIIATDRISRPQLFDMVSKLVYKNIFCKVVPHVYDAVAGNVIRDPEGAIVTPFLVLWEEEFNWYRGAKRIFDLAFSITLLIVVLPLMGISALLIKVTSPGPIFFKQRRVGLYGKEFSLYKFRTMRAGAEEDGPAWAAKNDPRITPLGRFLRRVRLDELPQLYNVLKNEMSLVGPRPERAHFVKQLMEEIPFYLERVTVKPGITGWAQITSPYADTVEKSREKFINDAFYIKNMSFSLDLYILLKTVWIVIQEKGAH